MELLGLVLLAFIVGLFLKNRNDNTAETVKKGCGCLLLVFLIGWVIMAVVFAVNEGWI